MLRLPLLAILFAISSAPLARGQRTSCVFTRDNYGNSIKICKPSLTGLRSSQSDNQPPPNCPPPPPVYLNKYYMPSVPYNVPPGCPTYGYPPSPQYQASPPPVNYPQYGYPDQQQPYAPQSYYPPAYGQPPPAYGQPPPPQYPSVTANYLPPQQPQQSSPHLVKQKSSDPLRSPPLMSNMQYGEAAGWKGSNLKSSNPVNFSDSQLQMVQTPLNVRSSSAIPQMDSSLQVAPAPQTGMEGDVQQNLQEKLAELKECKDQLKTLSEENRQLKENLEEIARSMLPSMKQQTKRDSSSTVHHSGKPPEAVSTKKR